MDRGSAWLMAALAAAALVACGSVSAPGVDAAACPTGSTGPNCDQCAVGFQDNDGDGTCTADCSTAPPCQANAACDDSAGTATCTCVAGYTGPACDQCDTGFQDNDGDGTCSPACAPATCSNAGTCADASGTAVCDCNPGSVGAACDACAAGFSRVGGVCTWTDVIVNGVFGGSGAPWVSSGATTFSGGAGNLLAEAFCTGGEISQTVTMPAYEDAIPLVLQFNAIRRTTDNAVAPVVLINHAQHAVTVGNQVDVAVPNQICLGTRAYGGPVTFTFGNGAPLRCGAAPVSIDDVSIVPAIAGQCPTPGAVANGDFLAAGQNWTSQGNVTFMTGRASLAGSPCASAAINGTLSIPDAAGPGAALVVSYQLSGAGSASDVRLLTRFGDVLAGAFPTSSPTTVRTCVPPSIRGSVQPFSLAVADPGGGLCADTWSGAITSVALTTDPTCGAPPVLDPGFESNGAGWQISASGNSPAPVIVDNAAQAHAGSRFAQIDTAFPCGSYGFTTSVASPPVTSGGVRVSYFYRRPIASRSTFTVNVGGVNDTPPATSGWTPRSFCLPAALAGRGLTASLTSSGGSGTCATAYPNEQTQIDDLMLMADPGCPAM
ncbi:MAG: calcium-binding EGF-like domain-containing protein [Kofleriaceae bacterium]